MFAQLSSHSSVVIFGDQSPEDLCGNASAEPSIGVATRRNRGGFWTGAIGSMVREGNVDLLNPVDVLHRGARDQNSA